ncbi:MAG: T9SS type A sorting domain-containing protein, partial [Verrucomicrobiae bacterium]|nr:T9SS type A sorting domain-containing protein [Verrucomicrobiae bacterium]
EGVFLSWQTHYEESNAYMLVERSVDGYQFREIGRVAGAGDTKLSQDYYFVDDHPLPGVNYYRLRQVDFDGAEHVHRVVSVRVRSKDGLTRFFPTLATDHLTVHYPEPPQNAGTLFVLNTLGRVIRQVDIPQGALQQQFNISTLMPGTYILQYREGRKSELLGRFVKL